MLVNDFHAFMRIDSFGKLWWFSVIHSPHLPHDTCHVSYNYQQK